jgi:hypothetical protein
MHDATSKLHSTYTAMVASVTGEQPQENNKGKQMETSTSELIAKLMNLSNTLAIELRFKESSLVLEVVGLLHSLPSIAESNRGAWHPSLNISGPSKGITYSSTVSQNND